MSLITIHLENDIFDFVSQQAPNNLSGYINALLKAQRQRLQEEAEMIAALKEDAKEPAYRAEIAQWNCVAGDGIDASE